MFTAKPSWVNSWNLAYKHLLCSDPSIDNPHSRVEFHCDESASDPTFETEDEDNYVSINRYLNCFSIERKVKANLFTIWGTMNRI